ncbi:MAG: 16S rRNA methyltransferase [Promethearchaeota archaeon]
MPLFIIFVECGIELVPKEIRKYSAVRKNLSEHIYSSQLLDNALHHSAMKNLENREKRGRPDISHLCLLNALGSPLNKCGYIRIYLHTINNKIFEFNPDIRIARNYNRFKGLMAKLLIDSNIGINGNQLISEVKSNLQDLISTFNNPDIILFSHKGELVIDYNEIFLNDASKDTVAIIGGFQKGNFSDDILALSKKIISISHYPLDAWIVTNKIITYYELNNKISLKL